MLILIILGVLTVVGIVLVVLYKFDINHFDYDLSYGIGLGLIFFAGAAMIIASGFAIGVQVTKDKDYQNALYEKQVLEYRLDHIEENLVGSELLYSDITEFNNELRTCKYYVKSPWLGLFYNDKIATIEYIEISETEGA